MSFQSAADVAAMEYSSRRQRWARASPRVSEVVFKLVSSITETRLPGVTETRLPGGVFF